MEPYYQVAAAFTPQEAETIMNKMKDAGYKVMQVSFWRDNGGSDRIIITFEREK